VGTGCLDLAEREKDPPSWSARLYMKEFHGGKGQKERTHRRQQDARLLPRRQLPPGYVTQGIAQPAATLLRRRNYSPPTIRDSQSLQISIVSTPLTRLQEDRFAPPSVRSWLSPNVQRPQRARRTPCQPAVIDSFRRADRRDLNVPDPDRRRGTTCMTYHRLQDHSRSRAGCWARWYLLVRSTNTSVSPASARFLS